eukprot:TRINITY_DN59815_c0_g3_i1.p2 TRINITY_DN59815_c0_g3~~TRINITY_DN59815_c0_g3_i1.p2  ORF type:complete len:1157 (-),score=209.00 TRINITY_DN59815_c0_g3_i1:3519-6989(-)
MNNNKNDNIISENELNNLSKELDNEHNDIIDKFIKNTDVDILKQIHDKQNLLAHTDENWEQQSKELSAIEDKEVKSLFDNLIAQEQEQLEQNVKANDDIISAAMKAAKEVKDNKDNSLANIRKQHEKAVDRLQIDMYNKKQQAERRLQEKIKEKHKKVKQDIISKSVENGDFIDEDTAEKQAIELCQSENNEEWNELKQNLSKEESKKLQELQDSLRAQELKVMESQHSKAIENMVKSEHEVDEAQAKLAAMRTELESETNKLDDKLLHTRKVQEDKLKAKLAEKKRLLAKKLEESNASKEQQRIEEEKLAEEAHESMLALQQKQLEEEEEARLELDRIHKAKLAEVLAETKQKETEAAIAAIQEASLASVRDIKAKNEDEIRNRELQRLREEHAKEEERQAKLEQQQQKQNKDKLAERIAAKRAKKEAELKKQEEQALAELAAKQEAEKKEKEMLKDAKKIWTDKLNEAIEKAEQAKLEKAQKEDFLLQETLGKKIVPENHLTECVELILKDRHAAALKDLLTAQYNERVNALTAAVEKVMEEKKQAKLDLFAKIAQSKEGDEDNTEFTRTAIKCLDEEYVGKQHQAELKATAAMESIHMKQQMTLRQDQLNELASIISMYSDADAMAKLQAINGKTQIEEMAEYRDRLEAERKAREEKMEAERLEREEELRKSHEAEIARMEEELRKDKERQEAAMEVKRQAIERQKAEAEKKALDEAGTLDKKEKERILADFEKQAAVQLAALQNEKKEQKSKLQERLAAKRKTHLAKQTSSVTNNIPDTIPESEQGKVESSTTTKPTEKPKVPKLAKQSSMTNNNAIDTAAAAEVKSHMSKIESKLERIEKVMSSLENGGLLDKLSNAANNDKSDNNNNNTITNNNISPNNTPTYRDNEEPPEGETLEVMEDTECSLQLIARLDFGRKIAQLIGLKQLTIKAAKSLPPSNAMNNAFRNSYYYDEPTNTLYVHNKKISSSGDFGLIVIHALSHIKVNPHDLSNDADIMYIAEFYKNLKILSQDLYKKSSSDSSSGNKHNNSGLNIMKAQSSFKDNNDINKSAVKKDGKMRGISDDNKSSDYYAPDSIRERLKLYTSESNNGSGYNQPSIPSSFFDRYSQEKTNEKKTMNNNFISNEQSSPNNDNNTSSIKPPPNDSSISERLE